MISKTDWLAAADSYMAAERELLGELPTPEDVVAYANGELDEDAAGRVRAALVYEPALTDLLLEDVPDNVVPIVRPRRSQRWMAIAAMVVLAVTALLFVQSRNPDGPEQYVDLRPSQYRGASAAQRQIVTAGGSEYRFTALLLADRVYTSYAVALVDADGDELWDTNRVQRDGEAIIRVTIPGRKMKPGLYSIVVYGDGEVLQTYPIRVEPPQ
jgi:hypothetical protein